MGATLAQENSFLGVQRRRNPLLGWSKNGLASWRSSKLGLQGSRGDLETVEELCNQSFKDM